MRLTVGREVHLGRYSIDLVQVAVKNQITHVSSRLTPSFQTHTKKQTHNPLLSSNRILLSANRANTLPSLHISTIPGAHRFTTCTGSFGSSHHPSISPECALFGLWILPSANRSRQFEPVRIAGSCALLLTMDSAGEVGERGDVGPPPPPPPVVPGPVLVPAYDELGGGMVIRGGLSPRSPRSGLGYADDEDDEGDERPPGAEAEAADEADENEP